MGYSANCPESSNAKLIVTNNLSSTAGAEPRGVGSDLES